jgi:two-component system, NtrC family, sensor histidine kinase HydH
VTGHVVLDLVAWAGHLAVAILLLIWPERNPLVWPMRLLAFNFFAWNFADFAFSLSGRPEWHLIDLGTSPFSPTLALHVIARFVGQTTARRVSLAVAYLCSAGLAGISWLALVSSSARSWIASDTWSFAFLVMDVAAVAVGTGWLIRHARRVTDPFERIRTQTMIAALLIGALLSTTDFWDDFGIHLPQLANLGSLLSASLLTMASLRFRIFDKNLSPRVAFRSLGLAATGVAGYAATFRLLSHSTAAVMLGTTILTLLLVMALRQLTRGYFERRYRVEALARQGRFGAQMAHDLKNPLAALKGAVQYLNEDLNRGGTIDRQRQVLMLLSGQVDRINNVVDEYAQLGHLQPRLAETDLNQLVRKVITLQAFVRKDIALDPQLETELPVFQLDSELVARALENLVRNSTEAMPQGGIVSVRTAVKRSRGRVVGASLAVHDRGAGMDARHAARALEDFFTTKPHGTGLGLAFTKRVVEAHGGRLQLSSKVGIGTSVTLYFPINGEVSNGHDGADSGRR